MKNIDTILSSLNRIIIRISLVFLCLTLSLWLIILVKYHFNKKNFVRTQINLAISVYETNLYEKLNNIANSDVFKRFLHATNDNRDIFLKQFLNKIHSFNEKSIVGMSIKCKVDSKNTKSLQNKIIFNYGKASSYYLTLKICYLNHRLNLKSNLCEYSWKLYFSKYKLIDALKHINGNIRVCKRNCNLVNLTPRNVLGHFPIIDSVSMYVNLDMEEYTNVLIYFVVIINFILLLIFVLLICYHTRDTINKTIANPLRDMITSIKEGHRLPNTKNYIEELKYLNNQVKRYYEEKDKIEITRIVNQAAHDIRSPLIALETAIKNLSGLSEQQRILIRNATLHIRDIANNLLQQNINKESINLEELRGVMLIPIIEYVLSEKRVEVLNKDIQIISRLEAETYALFIKVISSELKRILSNILNNSIDALNDIEKGLIQVHVKNTNTRVIIEIIDNGCGVSKEKISEIFKEGVSFKKNGAGLGLYYAQQNIVNWHGQIQINSQEGIGTKVTIFLPKQPIAKWFIKNLRLFPNSTLIVVDDIKAIRSVWQHRLDEIKGHEVKIKYFGKPDAFLSWYDNRKEARCEGNVFLIDHEFSGEVFTGLDIIKKMNKVSQCYLVTSKAEDFNVQDECLCLGIKIIPKYFLSHIFLSFIKPIPDIVFLEKDLALLNAWEFRAIRKGLNIKLYSHAAEFVVDMRLYPRKTRLFISSEFFDIISTIIDIGFEDITIVSHEPEKFRKQKKVKIHSKYAPF